MTLPPSFALDRRQAPAVSPLVAKALPTVETAALNNGLLVHLIRFGTQPVAEVQVVFGSGHSHESKPGLDTVMLKMLTEGTTRRSGLELAQAFDTVGAFVQTHPGYEVSTVTLSVLTKRLAEALALLAEVVQQPAFAAQEWEAYATRTRQALAVEQQKTAYHARRAFVRMAYGEGHPYGASLGLSELEALTRADLASHHATRYGLGPVAVLVAGQFESDEVLRMLETTLGTVGVMRNGAVSRAASQPPQPESGLRHIPLPGHLQATLRVGLGDDGRFSRGHADYAAMRLLTTVLGGYFGSRLMSNLREEKGFTYGIHAQWSALRYGGHLLIGTDVGNAFVQPALGEIRREIERLRQELIPADELEVARNYLLGRMLSEQETPFQIADILKNQLVNELPADEYRQTFDRIRAATPESLQALAQSYLRPERLIEVVSGAAE